MNKNKKRIFVHFAFYANELFCRKSSKWAALCNLLDVFTLLAF